MLEFTRTFKFKLMKFTCEQSVLDEMLDLVGRAVPTRATHPILSCVLFNAVDGCLSLTGFDQSLGINLTFPVEIKQEGFAAIPAKLLNEIVSKLPKGSITLEEQDLAVTLTCSSGKYQLQAMQPEEFPQLPSINDTGTKVNLDSYDLSTGIKNTIFSASPEEAKQVLNGIHFTFSKGMLEFAATDGHRLAIATVNDDKYQQLELPINESEPSDNFKVTLPVRALVEMERMLPKVNTPIVLTFAENQVMVQMTDSDLSEEKILTARTLDGLYPAYRQLLPPTFKRTIVVDRRALIATTERLNIFADKKANTCKCSISQESQQLTFSIDTRDVGNCEEKLSAQITGDSIDMAFNIKYLLDVLRVVTTENVEIQANEVLAPVILRPVGGSTNAQFLVMPVQLRG